PQEALANQPPDEHELARLVELARQLAGAERRLGREDRLELLACVRGERDTTALERERRVVEIRDHGWPALQRRVGVELVECAQLRERLVDDRSPSAHEPRAQPPLHLLGGEALAQ